MGFKAIKAYYDIKHIVAVYNEERYGGRCICIGSPYIHDLIVIRVADAKVVQGYDRDNDDLARYYADIKEDENNGILRELINTPDVFTQNLPIFTIKNWVVVADYCEEYGWPNTTNSGYIMYENTYFKTREEAYAYILKNTAAGVRCCNFKHNFREGYNRIKRAFCLLFRACWFWVLARTIGHYNVLKGGNYDS